MLVSEFLFIVPRIVMLDPSSRFMRGSNKLCGPVYKYDYVSFHIILDVQLSRYIPNNQINANVRAKCIVSAVNDVYVLILHQLITTATLSNKNHSSNTANILFICAVVSM